MYGLQGLSFEAALRRLEHERKDSDASGFYTSRSKLFGCLPGCICVSLAYIQRW